MNYLSDRVESLSMPQTLAMSNRSRELNESGVDVINMSVGEPDFNTPDHIKEAAKRAIDENFSRYTPIAGYDSLRQAIVDKLARENGLSYTKDRVVVSTGAKQALCNVILSTINPGDEVVIPTPAWVSYVEMVKLAGGKAVLVPSTIEEGFKITPEKLKAAFTPKTKMVLICSPSNPTGAVYSREELQGLVDVLKTRPEILVMSDEVYERINFTGGFTSMGSFPEIADQVVLINGVSKAYAMTGWRIGYSVTPVNIAKAITRLQGQYTSGASSIAQKAAEAAYNGPQECVEEMRKAFERRRNLIVELASKIPGVKVNVPDGAFYLFPEVSEYIGRRFGSKVIETGADLAMYLLEEGHVATVDGGAFGTPGYLRFSFATSDSNIEKAIGRVATAFGKLVK
ncbi:MAG: pyridoxal phosphate-dependent aminotransferase [Bacteroides sp.]|nr:pyridoxal phosphate-dependent aminotransferase [Bacteroides sp.]MDE5810125.1 pyridoxal phosphate-dependent aminotransferase [Muribaculaceae bacterium]